MKITKQINQEHLVYNILDNYGKVVDNFVLEYYNYKKKLENVFFKKMVTCLSSYERKSTNYDPKTFRAELFVDTGVLVSDDYVLLFNTCDGIKELVTEIRYDCYFQHINNLSYKLTVDGVNALKDALLNTKRENLPDKILLMLEKLENSYGVKDLYQEIMFLCLEGSYKLGLNKARNIEAKFEKLDKLLKE